MAATGQPSLQQGAVEQFPGMVAEKRPACSVGAFEARSEPDNEKARRLAPEGGNRPVEPIAVRGFIILPKRNEARA